jgi:hypothetical protein
MTYGQYTKSKGVVDRQAVDQMVPDQLTKSSLRIPGFVPANDHDLDPMKIAVIEHLTGQRFAPRQRHKGHCVFALLLVVIAMPVFLRV